MVKAVAVLARRHQVAILFINQLRANTNQGPDISAGPKALKYNTTMKVDLRRASGEKPEDTQITMKFEDNPDPIQIGVKIKARVVRNKVAPQGFSGEFWIFNVDTDEWGPIGVNRADEALSIGIRLGIIDQGGGGNYTMPDGRKVRGREKVMAILLEELDLVDSIREQALEQISGEVIPQVEVDMVDA
jgi:recA bacterial DNA recombination protein